MNNRCSGRLEKENNAAEAVAFLATIFDRPGRGFTWRDCLPGPYDEVWSWKLNGERVSALVARPYQIVGAAHGIGLGMIASAPERRSMGFATALIGAVAEQCSKQGGSFVVLWARSDMTGFYQTIGFKDQGGEYDYTVTAPMANGEESQSYCIKDFDYISHKGFDSLRRDFQGQNAVTRRLRDGYWHGLSGSRGGELSMIFDGDEDKPTFYAVVIHGGRPPIILEFVGSHDKFSSTIAWINTNLSPAPVSYSLTSPNLERHLACVDIVDRKEVFHTMVLPLCGALCGAEQIVPTTTWLDRI